MKIATFNANSIRSRIGVVTAWLAAQAPDVLCLQETKTVDEAFPAEAIEGAGYAVVYRGEKAYNGVALIAKSAPAEVRFGLDDGGPADETRLVHAKVGKIHIVNTYVPQGRDIEHAMYQYKLQWFARLKEYFARHFTPRTPLVWLGDLNVAPEAMDIHNAEEQEDHVCYHVDVRRAFADVVRWGFVDVFRKHRPEPGQYTFFDYRTPNAAKRGMGWRIDHILATAPLAAKSAAAYVDLAPRLGPKPSDHTFLAAEFDV
ncbi:MAG TPA: exodeoxyribonuclease III [Planctomycetota bacterium]|jgi:exodeoxyribonuclease-3|nr:exodeoxyribonuclease III [Planctomycetota bacterium]OQC20720.1 MAG: Exodeoxyribonuclease III [Planctomycetes bacterium ADurb.Bin069]NMD34832.1 exodeoxyribonuclease III [Planctomycetota bacterium]HNR98331.1 exodeoxyribonuclease III [Planctomycetota bacterium]HNU24649.1 exodeoxyribonuclease III [Planctomycetota bacterium]